MRKAIIFFCILLVFISFKAEAKIEKIGTENLEILLSKDYQLDKGIEVPFLLRNTSGDEQKVYYELTSFKTKENKMITAELFEVPDSGKRETLLTYKGEPQLLKNPSTFHGNALKTFNLKFQLKPESDTYTGILNIYAFPSDANKPNNSSNLKITFTIKKYVEPKKEPPKLNLEINKGSKETIYIPKVVGWFSGNNDDKKPQIETKETSTGNADHNIELENKTKRSGLDG